MNYFKTAATMITAATLRKTTANIEKSENLAFAEGFDTKRSKNSWLFMKIKVRIKASHFTKTLAIISCLSAFPSFILTGKLNDSGNCETQSTNAKKTVQKTGPKNIILLFP
jgi:hypothetical protein